MTNKIEFNSTIKEMGDAFYHLWINNSQDYPQAFDKMAVEFIKELKIIQKRREDLTRKKWSRQT